MKNSIKDSFSNFLFEYETPRQVIVKNSRIAVVCRIIQLGVLAYIVGWVFMYEKGYQTMDTAIGSVLTKMKGLAYTNITGVARIWDVADYVFPEQGDSSFVVMTNYISTKQTQGKCPEIPDGKNKCNLDADCDEGKYKRTGNGHMTGKCVKSTSTCEIYSWCPVEDDRQIPDPPILQAAENYTLFIKNSITFRQFNVVRLGDIVERSGFNFSEIARVGGSIGILIDWDCNLDLSIRYCKPNYEFHGLYGTGKDDKEEKPSLGYNFRYGKYFVEDKVEKRTLMKVFGIRINIIVHGRAGKFDIIPTLMAVGSGVGIFGVATVICDLLLLYLLPKRDYYKNMKFKNTEIQEEKPDLPPSQTEKDQP
ncbi:P2X purinoceptor 1-like isoform X3 [Myxocyprinus asiaticus]|uniref:P2X purinoceptor 1-like isoform X3 n=1 Tax=Myxocyprinus asiaticus TaxID=70543 RepID=UPI0022236C85|nr:P2X purinoceptor 1-like isoform X3 [Myxocyprinus asiaticus]